MMGIEDLRKAHKFARSRHYNLDVLVSENSRLDKKITNLHTILDTVEADNAKLMQDRERLEWLVEHPGHDIAHSDESGWCWIDTMDGVFHHGFESFRAALDAAKGEG